MSARAEDIDKILVACRNYNFARAWVLFMSKGCGGLEMSVWSGVYTGTDAIHFSEENNAEIWAQITAFAEKRYEAAKQALRDLGVEPPGKDMFGNDASISLN